PRSICPPTPLVCPVRHQPWVCSFYPPRNMFGSTGGGVRRDGALASRAAHATASRSPGASPPLLVIAERVRLLRRAAATEVRHEQGDDCDEVDLSQERLGCRQRVAQVGACGQVSIADRRKSGKAEVQAVRDARRLAAGEERIAAV